MRYHKAIAVISFLSCILVFPQASTGQGVLVQIIDTRLRLIELGGRIEVAGNREKAIRMSVCDDLVSELRPVASRHGLARDRKRHIRNMRGRNLQVLAAALRPGVSRP